MIQAIRKKPFKEFEKIGYWNYDELDYDEKISPSDMGELKFKYIIENEIKLIGDDGIEEEL